MQQEYLYHSPVGTLAIASDGKAITSVRLTAEHSSGQAPADAVLAEAAKQLDEYFAGTRKRFELPLSPAGTGFQQRVWERLCTIPYGETRSYGEIAAAAGNHKACRAVGMANNRNPIMIIIPCHRVVGTNGSLTGYAGGLEMKKYLLELESRNK